MSRARYLAIAVLSVLPCCLLPAERRVELDGKVGRAQAAGWTFRVHGGQAQVRTLASDAVTLWAQAPTLTLEVARSDAVALPLRVDVLNCVEGSELRYGEVVVPALAVDDQRASCRFELPALTAATLHIAPSDADVAEPFVFAVLSDVQRAVGEVHEIFTRMNEDPALRFVVSTGDLVDTGEHDELERFEEELELLQIPFYSTVGNHEMGADPRHWHERFGPFNVHFRFKGVYFSLVDSGNATIDPQVYEWLDGWLAAARDDVHVVLTHVPPLDPVGLRGGGFRSRKEGAKLMEKLAAGRVDVLFLGHIHSYYAFSIAGVPTHISGGGGAIEERLDGVERHYLRVRARPGVRIESVGIVRID